MDVNRLKQLYDSGMNAEEIAKEMNYSVSYIKYCLPKYKISHGKRSRIEIANPVLKTFCLKNGHTGKSLSEIIGCTQQKACAFMAGDREVRFSIDQVKRLLTAMGKTFEEVFA